MQVIKYANYLKGVKQGSDPVPHGRAAGERASSAHTRAADRGAFQRTKGTEPHHKNHKEQRLQSERGNAKAGRGPGPHGDGPFSSGGKKRARALHTGSEAGLGSNLAVQKKHRGGEGGNGEGGRGRRERGGRGGNGIGQGKGGKKFGLGAGAERGATSGREGWRAKEGVGSLGGGAKGRGEGGLHPSWEAKRAQAEKQKAVVQGLGRKIVFDD